MKQRILLPLICLVGFSQAGCAYNTRTIERCGVFFKTYRFIDPQFRDRVTIQVPKPWKISQPPDGGLCGYSCFRNGSNFGTILYFDAKINATALATDTQASLVAEFRQDDIKNESERIASYAKSIAEFSQANPHITFSDAPTKDMADVRKMGESRTKDGRMVCIWRIQSPTRGKELRAWIPENGFMVTIFYYSSSDDNFEQSDVDVIVQTIALYSNNTRTNIL
jgi:hypothetical protein